MVRFKTGADGSTILNLTRSTIQTLHIITGHLYLTVSTSYTRGTDALVAANSVITAALITWIGVAFVNVYLTLPASEIWGACTVEVVAMWCAAATIEASLSNITDIEWFVTEFTLAICVCVCVCTHAYSHVPTLVIVHVK